MSASGLTFSIRLMLPSVPITLPPPELTSNMPNSSPANTTCQNARCGAYGNMFTPRIFVVAANVWISRAPAVRRLHMS